jgi:F0F1-type ATP synthase beta subunit
MKKIIVVMMLLTATVAYGDEGYTIPTGPIQIVESETIAGTENIYHEYVEIQDLIDILEKALPHVWSEHKPYGTMTLQIDYCITDPICMAERNIEQMKERKKLSKRIEEVVRILKEATK